MANEGTYGGLGGMAGGAALGAALAAPTGGLSVGMGALLGAGVGGSAGGLLGGLFSKGPKTPDISGELNNIKSLFEKLRAQAAVNINREAASGRRVAANNLASRGTYPSPVAEHSFNALEGERLNALANSEASLAGQEASMRSRLLETLLGMRQGADDRAAAIDANRTGAISSIASNILLAALMRGSKPTPTPGPQLENSPLLPYTDQIRNAPLVPPQYQYRVGPWR